MLSFSGKLFVRELAMSKNLQVATIAFFVHSALPTGTAADPCSFAFITHILKTLRPVRKNAVIPKYVIVCLH